MRRFTRLSEVALLLTLVCSSAVVRAQDTTQAPTSNLIGVVVDSAVTPIAGAEVALLGSMTLRTVTNDSGQFRLTGLPSGSVVLSVRRLGFESATFTAQLKPGRTHRATFPLSGSVARLAAVGISDTVNTHWLDQFEARRSSQRGGFLTRADIEKRAARSATDLMRSVPGTRIQPAANGQSELTMTRAAGARTCLPQLFVHNVPYSGTLDDFSADDVEALEVYIGISEIPAELNRSLPTTFTPPPARRGGRGGGGGGGGGGGPAGGVGTPCAVIVVWTRDPKKRP